MIVNIIKMGLRILRKHKVFSFINIAGLAVGLAGSLLIFMYVQGELSYDRFHKNRNNIYRVLMDQKWNPLFGITKINITPGGFAPRTKEEFPEVRSAARIMFSSGLVGTGEVNFNERGLWYVDPEFLEIFDFPLVKGDPQTALTEPFSILLTEEMALKYFGDKDPIGRVLNLNKDRDYVVTGILKDVPQNSHLQFNFLSSFSTQYTLRGADSVESWRSNRYSTYLLLYDGADPEALEAKFPAFLEKHKPVHAEESFLLQPLAGIHLYSQGINTVKTGDIKYVYFLSAVAFFILLIACFNMVNLSTARASIRAREVGMRKVVGADRRNLIRQFLGESVIFTLLSLLLALGLAAIFLPTFNSLVQRELSFDRLFAPGNILIMLGLLIGTGVASGSYPAVFLSRFQPTQILRGRASQDKSGSFFRNILVVLQFSVSIILIICTLVVGAQLSFMKNKDLGFRKEEIVVVNVQDANIVKNPKPLENALSRNPRILDVLITRDLPTTIRSNSTFKKPEWGGENAWDFFYINWGWVGQNFLDFFAIELVQGRMFSPDHPTDKDAYIINEAAARAIDWQDPIGKRIRSKEVIGVVKDFHVHPLRVEIEPVALSLNPPEQVRYFSLKIDTREIQNTLAFIERTWKQFSPGYPYTLTFYDETVDRMYNSEKRLLRIFNSFAALAIMISCLGLFGLALFAADRRTKEIGVRKVLGASISQILLLLTKEFTRWVILANIFAWPVGYLAMKGWLNGFAYRTNIGLEMFVLAGVLAFAVALLTVGYHAVKAARANPIESLRYE